MVHLYCIMKGINFNSHASCEARQYLHMLFIIRIKISTHTPLARRDASRICIGVIPYAFQLTRLLRGATSETAETSEITVISTHTPLARRDTVCH